MKRLISLLLILTMFFVFVGCDETETSDNTDNINDTASPNDDNETPGNTNNDTAPPDTKDPSETDKPVVYEPNLPENIFLTKGESKASVARDKRAEDIFDEMELVYVPWTQYNEEDYPNGIPYTLWYKGEDKEGWSFITLTEWFDAGYQKVHLHSVSVTFNAFECPDDITILGIKKNATKEDVFSILGSPHSEIKESSMYTYYWKNITIGDIIIPIITVEVKKGTVIYVDICFDKL